MTVTATSIGRGVSGLGRVAPTLAGRIAAYLWFTPFPLGSGRAVRRSAWAPSRSIPSGAGPIRVVEIGDGPRTALLVHGWAGSARQYRRLASRLAQDGFRSVIVDLPGHGVAAGARTDVHELADAIAAVGASVGRVDLLVTHSLGTLAAAYAMDRGLEADAIVLLAPGTDPAQAMDRFASGLGLAPGVVRTLRGEMERRFGTDIWAVAPGVVREVIGGRSVVVVHDEDDDMVPIDAVRSLAAEVDARLVVTSGLGHNGVLRSPDVIEVIAAAARGGVAGSTAA